MPSWARDAPRCPRPPRRRPHPGRGRGGAAPRPRRRPGRPAARGRAHRRGGVQPRARTDGRRGARRPAGRRPAAPPPSASSGPETCWPRSRRGGASPWRATSAGARSTIASGGCPPGRYREYDLHPRVPGQNRGPERLVVEQTTGRAYYTARSLPDLRAAELRRARVSAPSLADRLAAAAPPWVHLLVEADDARWRSRRRHPASWSGHSTVGAAGRSAPCSTSWRGSSTSRRTSGERGTRSRTASRTSGGCRAPGYRLVVRAADRLLARDPAGYATFVALLEDVGRAWGTAATGHPGRGAVPFHTVLVVSATSARRAAELGCAAPDRLTRRPRARRSPGTIPATNA